jgi:uncharacterized glyoxalase superfamily metalloenzyme YdcJ
MKVTFTWFMADPPAACPRVARAGFADLFHHSDRMCNTMTNRFANPLDMQHSLFEELSRMFGEEVPLYDKSLAVNIRCNRSLADMLESVFEGFSVSGDELLSTSRERHGAIRIGREDEFRWITRYFACFGMEPHNFYDMTCIGAKSQPVIATAFRSEVDPRNRVFASLLRTDYFADETARRIDALLSRRQVFSDRARSLVERSEVQGGLNQEDAKDLIKEGTQRIFKWTGEGRDRPLYDDLCETGFKIAADIACFSSHHLNHLTPNTLCIDLYSDAMKWRLGMIDRAEFLVRAERALVFLERMLDSDWLLLHFHELTHAEVNGFVRRSLDMDHRQAIISVLADELDIESLDLSSLAHNGYKETAEGPDAGVQILLRQDAYRALTEPICFIDETPHFETAHTARFGEIEQRHYATTPKGRALYDYCLTAQNSASCTVPSGGFDVDGHSSGTGVERARGAFAPFPETLLDLIEQGLVYATFEPSDIALQAENKIMTTDVRALMRSGLLWCRGLRYEDFLPISAAGIFASNLDQYGTNSTARQPPTCSREQFEAIVGRPVIDSDNTYRIMQSRSLLASFRTLGVEHLLDDAQRLALEGDTPALANW